MNSPIDPHDATYDVTPSNSTPQHDMTRQDTSENAVSGHDAGSANDISTPNQPTNYNSQNRDQISPDHQVAQSHDPVVMPTTDMTRQDTLERAIIEQDASKHDETRQDMSQHVMTRKDTPERVVSHDDAVIPPTEDASEENWIDIQQAEIQLRELGVPRSIRTVQRFCQQGILQSRLVPTETGSRYIISEQSIKDLAKRQSEVLPTSNQRTSAQESPNQSTQSAKPADEALGQKQSSSESHIHEITHLKDQHISMLESQLATANAQMAVKDQQIVAMLDRNHETNVLIQNLQRMFGLPEARPSTEIENRSGGSKHQNVSGFEQTG